MKIAPVDIRNQQFKKVVRGADPEEVRIFLAVVADQMEILINENRESEEKLSALQVQVEEYKKVELALRDTLLTAERLSSEAKDNSRKEAELILRDAGLKAERILDEAIRRACEIRKEIVELKNQKDIYIARLRSLVETQLKMLRFHSVDLEEQEGTIAKLERAQSLLGLDVEEPLAVEEASETERTTDETVMEEPAPGASPPGEVCAPVTDLGRARFFYVDKLGCRVLKLSDSEALVTGGLLRRKLLLKVVRTGELPAGEDFPILRIAVFLGGTRELFSEFEFSGVKIARPLRKIEGRRAEFTIEDPDGNMITFSGPP